MSEARAGLTSPEQRAAQVMVRFATEAGYRGLRWSVPNDATCVQPTLAAVPVHYDGLLPASYDLLGRRRFGAHQVICSLLRREGTFDVLGVPSEEWLRPLHAVDPPPSAAPPRRRATAVALGLLVPLATLGGGIAVVNTAGQGPGSSAVPAPSTPAPTAEAPRLPAGGVGWAAEATNALASIDEQLAVLAEAERAWNALPAQQRAGEPPAALRELVDNRARLEQLRAALEADLSAWRAMQQTTEALADTEEQLENVTRALRLGGPSSGQLREQQAMLIRQRDAQREQLEGWSEGVEVAVGTPLPDPLDMSPLAGSVLALTQQLRDPAESDDEDSVVEAGDPEGDRNDSAEQDRAAVPEVDVGLPGIVPDAVPEVDVDVPGIVPGAVPVPVDTGPVGGPLDFLIPDGDEIATTDLAPPVEPAPEDTASVDDLLGEIGRFGPDLDAAAPPAVGTPPPPAPSSELPQPKDMWNSHDTGG